MTEELRREALMAAQQLDNHGDIATLLKNAEYILKYLTASPFELSKEDRQPVKVEKVSFNDALSFIEDRKIRHSTKGEIPFKLYEHQHRVLHQLCRTSQLIINNARQMGITHLLAAYVLYEAVTLPNQTILWLSNQFSGSLHGLDVIRSMLDANIEVTMNNKSQITFSNGSTIIARALSVDSQRGLSLTRIVIDNAAYISHKKFYETWPNLMQVCGSGAKIVLASTPNLAEGLFYDIWMNGKYPWRKILIPWYEHLERDDEWIAYYQDQLDEARFKQEFECNFVSSSEK